MRCPRCQNETELNDNPFRPFCSQRCKLIDLGRWAAGDYRLPTQEQPAEEDPKPNGHLEEDTD